MIKKINKKGDMISMLYVIVIIAVIGIVIFFMSKIFYGFETQLSTTIGETGLDETNETREALGDIIRNEQVVWDYAFLGIVMGYLILIGIFSYQTPISPIFYWISVILAMFWLFVGTIMSNLWQGIAEQAELADTIVRFPIMNAILGTYYPTVVTFILIIGMIILFGKPIGGER